MVDDMLRQLRETRKLGELSEEELEELVWDIRSIGPRQPEAKPLIKRLQTNVPMPNIASMVESDYPGEDLVERALLWRREWPKLTRDELVELVETLWNAQLSEGVSDTLRELFDANVPHPAAFQMRDPQATAEEIVDFALSYKPRILPRDELVRVVGQFLHPKTHAEEGPETYVLICENMRGHEPNELFDWARRKGLTAEQLIDMVQSGEADKDSDYRQWGTDAPE